MDSFHRNPLRKLKNLVVLIDFHVSMNRKVIVECIVTDRWQICSKRVSLFYFSTYLT